MAGKNDEGKKLYSLSTYFTEHVEKNEEGKLVPYGFTISGYCETENGGHEYVNIWLKADPSKVKVESTRDGGFVLKLKMSDKTTRAKREKKAEDSSDF